jgi:hypothetical protein
VKSKLAILVVAISASVVVAETALSRPVAPGGRSRAGCGFDRWTVKTLEDRPRLLPVRTTTIAWLIARKPPGVLPSWRLPFERRVFRVDAAVPVVEREPDSDLHVTLQDGGDEMIAEAPAPWCTRRAKPVHRRLMAKARASVRVCARARVTGVAFFDFDHGNPGVAPNVIELHPILGFRCLSRGTPGLATSASRRHPDDEAVIEVRAILDERRGG